MSIYKINCGVMSTDVLRNIASQNYTFYVNGNINQKNAKSTPKSKRRRLPAQKRLSVTNNRKSKNQIQENKKIVPSITFQTNNRSPISNNISEVIKENTIQLVTLNNITIIEPKENNINFDEDLAIPSYFPNSEYNDDCSCSQEESCEQCTEIIDPCYYNIIFEPFMCTEYLRKYLNEDQWLILDECANPLLITNNGIYFQIETVHKDAPILVEVSILTEDCIIHKSEFSGTETLTGTFYTPSTKLLSLEFKAIINYCDVKISYYVDDMNCVTTTTTETTSTPTPITFFEF